MKRTEEHIVSGLASLIGSDWLWQHSALVQWSTYLRSTMSQARLTNLAILSIERHLTEAINFDAVIQDFAARKARKISF